MENNLYYNLGMLNLSLMTLGLIKKVALGSFITIAIISGVFLFPPDSKKEVLNIPKDNEQVMGKFTQTMDRVSYKINIINNILPDKK